MATAQQQQKQGFRVSIFITLAGMLVTFLAGIYVGLHPTWIPIKGSSYEDYSQPAKPSARPTTMEGQHYPMATPQTLPSQTQSSQTQP